jgi:hypothetical protein
MIGDKINEIVENLISATGDQINWRISKFDSMYKSSMQLIADSEDGLTKFEIELKYTLDGDRWKPETSIGMFIRNINLVGGSMYITSYGYPILGELRKKLMALYYTDVPKESDIEDKLDIISKGISKSSFRDGRINKILDGGSEK